MSHYEPETAHWSDLTVLQRGEIFHVHAMKLTDYDSSFDFVAHLSKLRWSFDTRPPEERLRKLDGNVLEITGTWYGYDENNTLVMEPPAMRRVSEDELESYGDKLHAATLNVKVSLFVARILTKLLYKHATGQYSIAQAHPQESMIYQMCSEEADYSNQAATGIQKLVDKYEQENDLK
jgi:hypothetical protein